MPFAARLAKHRDLAAELERTGDAELLELISESEVGRRGSGVVALPQSGARVFVKLLPLTALELQAGNEHSTANLFGLPAHYHYRIGSCGFGSWRELELHRLTTEWVLSGERPSFPLLHGWRRLPVVAPLAEDLQDVERWGAEPAIERRVNAISAATSSAVLFLEHVPSTLLEWLQGRLATATDGASLVRETESRLRDLLGFTSSRGLLHLDAHFENVLVQGGELILSDFGLSISKAFQLDAEERAFSARHQSFDLCTALTSNVHAVVSHYAPADDWRAPLRALLGGGESRLDAAPAGLRAYLAERGPLALAAGDFYRQLGADLSTEYPDAGFQALLDRAP